MEYNLESIDKNLKPNVLESENGINFYDVRKTPFQLYGFYQTENEKIFRRITEEFGASISTGVQGQGRNSAGGRVRFSTNSKRIAIKAKYDYVAHMPHMPLASSSGFSIFVDFPSTGDSRFKKSFVPPINMVDGYTSSIEFETSENRYFTIYFPLYSNVLELYVGIDEGATLGEGMSYRQVAPIVFYGSSISQGASASVTGNDYESIVSRKFNMDYYNFGFSGSAHGEEKLLEYLSKIPMSIFVSEYDHNDNTPKELRDRHWRMIEIFRKNNPTLPIILMSRIDYPTEDNPTFYETIDGCRRLIMEHYIKARGMGDRNIYYIDGPSICRGHYEDECNIDSVHPTDLGFMYMARAIESEIRRILCYKKIL